MIPSHPVRFLEYMSESFRIVRKVFLRSVLLLLVASLPLWPIIGYIYFMDQWSLLSAWEQTKVGGLFTLWVILVFFVQVMITELSIAEYEQRDEDLRYAFSHLRKNIPRILRFGLFLTMPILLTLTIFTVIINTIENPTVMFLIMIIIVVGALVLALRSWFYFPLVISENLTAFRAFRRIIRLTQGNHWRSLGYFLFSIFFVFAGSLLVDQVFELAGANLPTNILSNIGIIAGVSVIVPLQAAFQTVFYFDLRTRAEGPLAYEPS